MKRIAVLERKEQKRCQERWRGAAKPFDGGILPENKTDSKNKQRKKPKNENPLKSCDVNQIDGRQDKPPSIEKEHESKSLFNPNWNEGD